MKKTGAWLVRHALEQIGARYTFGIPGVHTTEIYDELGKSNAIQPVLVTHEAGAAFMADGISRTTDSIGVCVVVPAAGLTHAMSGIGEAFLDGIPMLVISGSTRTDMKQKYQLHQMDQQGLMSSLTKAQYKIETQADIVPTIYEAYNVAISGEPGPVYVEIPVNLQLLKGDVSDVPDYLALEALGAAVGDDQIEAAADALVAAKKPCIFAGWGAMGDREALAGLATWLGAPVSTSLQGLAVIPHDHPLHAGMGFGPAAVPAARAAFEGRDCMLAVGVRFAEIASGSFGAIPPTNLIHIDINAEAIGANYPVSIGIEGDAADVLPRLLAAVKSRLGEPRDSNDTASLIRAGKAAYKSEWTAHDSGGRVNPGVFFAVLDRALDADAIIATDDGNHTFLTAELMPVSGGRHFISPTDFNCMGYCIPAVNAAKLANPTRQVVGIVGDGAMMMTGMEALTAKAQGLGAIYCVFADGELSQIAQAQEVPYNRKVCTVLPPVRIDGLALATGAAYVLIADNDEVEAGIVEAIAAAAMGQPVFVEIRVDYSKSTAFTAGAIKTNFERFDLPTKIRMAGRALKRKITG